jgi:hypothetical protein
MRRLGAGRQGSGNSYEDLMLHPFFKDVNWLSIGTDPIPYDVKKLKEIIQTKSLFDICDTGDTQADTNDDTDNESIRQSEFNVELKSPGDFDKLLDKGKEVMKGYLMKRNPWFVNQKRLFILTSHPKILYFKDDKNLRGEIQLSKGTKAKKV